MILFTSLAEKASKQLKKQLQKKLKKVVDKRLCLCYIRRAVAETERRKNFSKKIKKLLTKRNAYDILNRLSQKQQQTRTLIIEQQPSLKIQIRFIFRANIV